MGTVGFVGADNVNTQVNAMGTKNEAIYFIVLSQQHILNKQILGGKMNDKEKQIEEMSKDIKNADESATTQLVRETQAFVKEHHRYHSTIDYQLAHNKTVHELVAEKLYEQGYRKLVDYDITVLQWAIEFAEQIIKKTARDILQELRNEVNVLDDYESADKSQILFWIDELAEQFGAEVKE